jgi:hypothetical protein
MRTAAPPEPAETGVYRPISALAVAALIVGGLTALLLIGFGIAAAISHRPFLNWFVLLMAMSAIGMSIAAKVQIARSQGTRAGGKIASAALLVSLTFGLSYLAYWFAIDFSVRKQSQEIAEKWLQYLKEGEPEKAFRLMRDPGQQKSMAEDPESIRRRFGNTELSIFTRSDVPRLMRSWKNRTELSFDGVHTWDTTPTGFEAELNFTLRFPEGIFPIRVTALGSDDPDTGDRVWQVVFGKTGLKQTERQLTTLGKLILDLQFKSFHQLREWYPKFVDAGPKAAEPLIRIEGKVPPEDQRGKVADELMKPGAINIYPGGPTRPLGYALVLVTDDAVEVTSVLETSLPSLGNELNTMFTQRVKGDQLVKEMLRLSGPGWQQQPINYSQQPELNAYHFELEPVEINIRPSGPKMGLKLVTAESTPTAPPK